MPPHSTEAEIRERAIAFFRSPAYDRYFKRGQPPRTYRLIVALVAFFTTVGIPLAIYQVYAYVRDGRRRKRARRELVEAAERSVAVMTYPIMANRILREVPGAVAPALVIGSFDPGATVDAMFRTAQRLIDLEPEVPDGEPPADLVEFLADETFQPGRRRRLPDRITDGMAVLAFDLLIFGEFQFDQVFKVPFIACLAEPGASGQILMIPWWVVDGSPAPGS